MERLTYYDFDLLIERVQDRYRARILQSPAGQATTEFALPFTDLEIENLILRVGRPRRGLRRVDSNEMQAAKLFGGKLFDAVFAGEIRGALRSSLDAANRDGAGLRLRLRLNDTPELVDLPWEFLYNAPLNRFLALSNKTPLVRYIDLPEPPRPLKVALPLRVLVMISSPSDYEQLEAEQEWQRMQQALSDLRAKNLVTLDRVESATLSGLRRKLRQQQYHVLHFIGHGGFEAHTQDGVLVLEDEQGRGRRTSGQYLAPLLTDHDSLRIVVLNACEGARTARNDPFAGVAQSLVQQGMPAVIAMQFEVTEETSLTFAHEFYSALADGYPVDAALSEVRSAIFSQVNDLEWGTPVLYMRSPNGVVFSAEPAMKDIATPTLPIKNADTASTDETANTATPNTKSTAENAAALIETDKAEPPRPAPASMPERSGAVSNTAAERIAASQPQTAAAPLTTNAGASYKSLPQATVISNTTRTYSYIAGGIGVLVLIGLAILLVNNLANPSGAALPTPTLVSQGVQTSPPEPTVVPTTPATLQPTSAPQPTQVPVATTLPAKPTSVPPPPTPLGGGGQIAYNLNGDLYLLDVSTQKTVQLTLNGTKKYDGSFSWSPDDTQIVFQSDFHPPDSTIRIIDKDGTNLRTIVSNAWRNWFPDWSPDGKKIAFASDREGIFKIYLMNPDGSNPIRLLDFEGSAPAWSPDGKRIAFQSDPDRNSEFQIYVMNSDGTAPIQLTQSAGTNLAPRWSPDASKILFYSERDGNSEVYIMNPDGSAQTNLTHSPGIDSGATWSPDGSLIAFASNRSGKYIMYLMQPDGTNVTVLSTTQVDGEFSWSHK